MIAVSIGVGRLSVSYRIFDIETLPCLRSFAFGDGWHGQVGFAGETALPVDLHPLPSPAPQSNASRVPVRSSHAVLRAMFGCEGLRCPPSYETITISKSSNGQHNCNGSHVQILLELRKLGQSDAVVTTASFLKLK